MAADGPLVSGRSFEAGARVGRRLDAWRRAVAALIERGAEGRRFGRCARQVRDERYRRRLAGCAAVFVRKRGEAIDRRLDTRGGVAIRPLGRSDELQRLHAWPSRGQGEGQPRRIAALVIGRLLEGGDEIAQQLEPKVSIAARRLERPGQ